MPDKLLEVRNLKIEFRLPTSTIYAVNGVSFDVARGEVLGLVGESGCGKSVTALSIPRLVAKPYGRIVGGEVLFYDGAGKPRDLTKLPEAELQKIRGDEISMVFQDPMTSLNPVFTVGFQLIEPLKIHRGMSEKQAHGAAAELLERVGIPEAKQRLRDYPHQFSGGMRQRVMIAMAAACEPSLLIADEPTTALDVTIQAQILDLLNDLRREIGTSIIIITHDLGVVAETADKVAVIYAGLVMESASVYDIYRQPLHPYTQALLASVPSLTFQPERLTTITGSPPDLTQPVAACPFAPRCRYRFEKCDTMPPLVEIEPGHRVACWLHE
ncbi:MAG: Oligopeptide transport ATP-binding protein OppD [Chloroflexi bacterium ADurb.Bin325]|nr:MAG: Oligopeptide transport ATP-binding protein OppD [Chloroflexi bacterium ADurb.Bin325]